MKECRNNNNMDLDAIGSADGIYDRELTDDFLFNTSTGSNSNDESDLNIDSTRSSSEYDSYASSRSYTSPRALILASKSSEEELVVPQSMVKKRHKWIERTLLNVKDDTANAPMTSRSSIRGVKIRHSLPENTTSMSPSQSSEDVLNRVLMTTKAMKLSREGARAKVQADISAMIGGNEPAEAEETSDQGKGAEISDLRARAQVKLNAAMELLDVASSRKTIAIDRNHNSPLNRVSPNADESCKMQEDEVKYEIPMQTEGRVTIDIEHDETRKYDADYWEEPMRRNDGMTMSEQSERRILVVEDEAQGEADHQEVHQVEAENKTCFEEQHDDDDLSEVQVDTNMANKNEVGTDQFANIEKQIRQEEEIAKLEEEVRQSVQKRLEQDSIKAAFAIRDEHEIDDESKHECTQVSNECDLYVNNSSNGSVISDSLLEHPSDNSDASLPSQVDEILYQGKMNNVLKQEGLQTNDSTENDYDDIDIENGSYSSASQSSDLDPSNDNIDMATPGPMWKMAAEHATMSNSETRLDALDPSATCQHDPFARRVHNHSWKVVNKTTEYEAETFSEWNGFNRERMICMVVIGVLAGMLPSLYAQWTCHFVTGDNIDDDESAFLLNFGLQEFTPIDSSFQGYDYCLDYDSKYNYNPPLVPRFAGIAATTFGTIPLLVIGTYLLFSTTHKILWNSSMWMLYFGSICQISTLSIFLLDLCQDGIACSMGPGAWATVVSSLAWFTLSIEMKVNSALARPVKSEGVVVIERESRFTSWLKKYWNSAIGEPSLSRTAMKMQKRVRKGGSEPGRYKPPVVI